MYEEGNDFQYGQQLAGLNRDFELLELDEDPVSQEAEDERNFGDINLAINWVVDLELNFWGDNTGDLIHRGNPTSIDLPLRRQDVLEVVRHKGKQPEHPRGLLDVLNVPRKQQDNIYYITDPAGPPIPVLPYIKDPIFHESYHVIFINENSEMLLLENHQGNLNTLKVDHYTTNGQTSQTPRETLSHAFDRTIQVTNQITGEVYGSYGIGQRPGFDQYNYVTMCVETWHTNAVRRKFIGLFIVHFDGTALRFQLRDFRKYQAIHFQSISDIPDNIIESELDVFYFIQTLLPQMVLDCDV